jgi:hypothetical protein
VEIKFNGWKFRECFNEWQISRLKILGKNAIKIADWLMAMETENEPRG